MCQLVVRLRRALAKLDEFLGGPLHWLDAFRPHCYCMACKSCTYHAKFRLYTALYNSCEACTLSVAIIRNMTERYFRSSK